MALKAELEDLLKVMKPEEAEAQRKLFEAYPQLADGYLRQADYSRQVAEARSARDRADKKFNENVEWWNQKKPLVDSWEAEKQALTEENVRLKTAVESASKVAAAGAGADGTVDVAAISQATLDRMKAVGGVFSREDIAKIAAEEAEKRVEAKVNDRLTSGISSATQDFLTKTFPAALGVIADINDLQFEHRAEFGKPLDRKALSQYMSEHKLTDARQAYEQMVGKDRAEKEIERRAQERAQQLYTERMGTPGSGAPGAVQPGPFQIRLSEDAKVDPMAGKDVKVGGGDLARAAAAELAAEGKF